jgi:hypothetical protein
MSLEELLNDLCMFGQPKLFRMEKGWHCFVDMHVPHAGSSFKVASDFDHVSAMNAAMECRSRIGEMLKSYAEQSKVMGLLK